VIERDISEMNYCPNCGTETFILIASTSGWVCVNCANGAKQKTRYETLRVWQLSIIAQEKANTREVLNDKMRNIVNRGGDHHSDGWPVGGDGTYLELDADE